MTTTELQFVRGYVTQLEYAYDAIEGLSYYAAKDTEMSDKLDKTLDLLSDVIQEYQNDITEAEKQLIKENN